MDNNYDDFFGEEACDAFIAGIDFDINASEKDLMMAANMNSGEG